MATRLPYTRPIEENRPLAPLPHSFWQAPFKWIGDADAWFSDHFGYRAFLIRAKTQIDYSVFSTSNRVYIGADRQLFYRSVMDREKPDIDRFLQARGTDIVSNVARLHSAFAARGIRMIVSVNLLADRFLPEKLPASSPSYNTTPQRIDQLIAQLNTSLGTDFFDVTPILQEVVKRQPIFHKTDFHWNSPAAGEAGKMIVNRLAKLENRDAPLWSREVKSTPIRLSGGIAQFMPLFSPPEETSLGIKKNFIMPSRLTPFAAEGVFESGYRTSQTDPELLPTMVVIADSFFDMYEDAGFPIYFQNFYRVRWSYRMSISRLVEALPRDTRLVTIQFIETSQFGLQALADGADIDKAIDLIGKMPVAANTAN